MNSNQRQCYKKKGNCMGCIDLTLDFSKDGKLTYSCQYHMCPQCLRSNDRCKCHYFICFGKKEFNSPSCRGNVSKYFTQESAFLKSRGYLIRKDKGYYACGYHHCTGCQRPKSRRLGEGSCNC